MRKSRGTDGRTDTAKLIVDFANLQRSLKTGWLLAAEQLFWSNNFDFPRTRDLNSNYLAVTDGFLIQSTLKKHSWPYGVLRLAGCEKGLNVLISNLKCFPSSYNVKLALRSPELKTNFSICPEYFSVCQIKIKLSMFIPLSHKRAWRYRPTHS
jgi:hypothetical protein